MDQKEDHKWKELKGILPDDVISKFEEIGPTAYSHQYEFIRYFLASQDQAPVVGLRSLTGSGKTLCFQALIYASYKKEIHSKIAEVRPIKGRDGVKDTRVLFPYTIVLGQTIYLKQHEENFIKFLPERLKAEGMTFQTFFALGMKDKQNVNLPDNRIEDANANVLLCHPSKIDVGIKMKLINVSNLRYLIIDEADQLLAKHEQNRARIETQKIIQFMIGQLQNNTFQIIFVSASLKEDEINEFIRECVNTNFENDKKVDKRFGEFDKDLDIREFNYKIQMLPMLQNNQIASYSLTHYYIDSDQPIEQTLVKFIFSVQSQLTDSQIMVFFNTKAETQKILKLMLACPELEFLARQNMCSECTGDTPQDERERVRKDFKEGRRKVLFCTDVLQRGLDFRKVKAIVHYGLPVDNDGKFRDESYYQRSGRTGRAKDEGVVLSILSQEDRKANRKEALIKALNSVNGKISVYEERKFIADLEKAQNFNQE